MKQQVAVQQVNSTLMYALIAAAFTLLFSLYAGAAQTPNLKTSSKSAAVKPAKKLSSKAAKTKLPRKASVKNAQQDSGSLSVEQRLSKIRSANTKKGSLNRQAVVIVPSSSRKPLLAQTITSSKALDAKLEGEVAQDSIPVAAPSENTLATDVSMSLIKHAVEVAAKVVISTGSTINTEEARSYSGSYLFNPSIVHTPSNVSLAAKIEYAREYSFENEYGEDGDFASPSLALRKKILIGGIIDDFSFGANAVIAAGNEARRQTFKGSAGPAISATKKLGILSVGQGFSYSYRFYQYDIRDNGVINSPHSFASTTALGLEVTKWLGLSAEFAAQHLIGFQGTPQTVTSTSASADFTLTEQLGISAGLATLLQGTLSADGQTNRAVLYDAGATSAFLDLNLSF